MNAIIVITSITLLSYFSLFIFQDVEAMRSGISVEALRVSVGELRTARAVQRDEIARLKGVREEMRGRVERLQTVLDSL